MEREKAMELIKKNIKNRNMIKHCIAVEGEMIALARHFGEDETLWGLTGLLHDVDYEQTNGDPVAHAEVGAQILEAEGYDSVMVHAVRAHNDKAPIENKLDRALFASDPLSGLIVAATLMHPEKKLAAVDAEFVLRRFKEKSFAAGANREHIQTCSELGLDLTEFVDICIQGMRLKADELGL
ncbi:MAG: HDIG domain-containing protein [Acidobacteria bacterium]|nr:HDIG domain-containing protein [Acidobacteriota bacterium]